MNANAGTTILATPLPNALINDAAGATVDACANNVGSVFNVAGLTSFYSSQTLAGLSVSGIAKVATGPTNWSRTIDTPLPVFGPAGQLNLCNNAMVVRGLFPIVAGGHIGYLTAKIASGLNNGLNGYWDGPGINSSCAANEPGTLTAIGALDNSVAGVQKTSFSDVTGLTGSEVIVGYTIWGDANLDSVANQTDNDLYVAGLNSVTPPLWQNGDFDYSGVVNGGDFDLFNLGMGGQGSVAACTPENCSVPTPYQITATPLNIVVDDMGTVSLGDDLITLDLFVTATGTGPRWIATTSVGTFGGAYNELVHVGPLPRLSLPITFIFADASNAPFYGNVTITALQVGTGGVPQDCNWSLRVVRSVTTVDSLAKANAALALPPTGSTVTSTRVPVINHNDPDGPGIVGLFPADSPLPGLAAGVNDNNVALLAETIIQVPANGDYTFNVHSDEGFSLVVAGASFRVVNGVGMADPANAQKLIFPGLTQDSHTLGVTYLTAGAHFVQFVGYEGQGVSSWEVSWARGAAVAESNTRAWKLLGCPSSLTPFPANCCGDSVWEDMERIQQPTARSGQAMAWDHERGVAVMFGGENGIKMDDTWLFDGVNWRLAAPVHKPSARAGHSMAFDDTRLVTLLFGGEADSGLNNETWLWDGADWTQVATPPQISVRRDHASAWDPVSQSVVITGGAGPFPQLISQSAWYDATGWHFTTSSIGQPPARRLAAAVSDPQHGKVWLYGGTYGFQNEVADNDLWVWNGNGTWTPVSQGAIQPGPRCSHAMAWDYQCGKVVLTGGADSTSGIATDTAHWRWNGTTWSSLPIAPSPNARRGHSMVSDPEGCLLFLFGGTYEGANTGTFLSDTWAWGCPCPDEEMETDTNGVALYPSGLTAADFGEDDAASMEGGTVSGFADELYPDFNTTNANFYGQVRCPLSLGGPDTLPTGHPVQDLTDLGITEATPEEVQAELSSMAQLIAAGQPQGSALLTSNGPLSTPWSAAPTGHCIPESEKSHYLFGGRDIVFVHGIRTGPLISNWFLPNDPNSAKSFTEWPADKAEFYPGGWWKDGAEIYWEKHIIKYLKDRGFKNRILVVAYPVTQRVDVCAQAILTQIADAMNTGVGVVVNPASVTLTGNGTHVSPAASLPNQPGTEAFGTPSFVIISHSMGALVTDIAMTAAAENSSLGCTHIPQMCKAHIAMRGAFNGSSYATATIALAYYIAHSDTLPSPPPWLCKLNNGYFGVLNAFNISSPIPQVACPLFSNDTVVKMLHSTLFDLVPAVAQWKWGGHMDRMPVRTLTLVGGHPSFLTPVKHVLALGYDDGTPTLQGQLATPNSWLLWPGGVNWRSPRSLPRAFDMYLLTHSGGLRAIDYFIDRAVEFHLNPVHLINPFFLAAGATPYITPHGMIQNDVRQPLINGFHADNRRPNHFSFLQSAGDHFSQMTPFDANGDFGDHYSQSYAIFGTTGETNNEEQLVITDDTVFAPWPRLSPGDDGPILRAECLPRRYQVESGPRLKKNGKKRRLFRWKRTHERLVGWTTKTDVDYMYETVLCGDTALICPPGNGWRLQYFATPINAGNAADQADPDRDGVKNLLERGFNMNPTVATLIGLPVFVSNLAGYSGIQFTRNLLNTDLRYEAEVSSDLVNWSVLAVSAAGGVTVPSGSHFVSETGSGTLRTVSVEDVSPASTFSRRYFRVRITVTPPN